MDKKKFLNIFEGEDKNLLAMVYEEIELCKKNKLSGLYRHLSFSPGMEWTGEDEQISWD